MKLNLRSITILLLSSVLCLTSNLFAQSGWSDYIQEEKGDTLVVKPTSTTGYLNTMFYAIMGDTATDGSRNNPNRVYETVRGGIYIYDSPANIDATVPNLKIVAADGTDMPPLHIKTTNPEGNLDKAFYYFYGDSFLMTNQYICQSLTNNTNDRNFFRAIGDNIYFEFDNCVVEMTNWAFLPDFVVGASYKITNCFVHNLGREANLEKGNFLDGTTVVDTAWFENNTFLNTGNVMLSRPNAGPSFMYFNHNTVVNATNHPFLFFSQAEMAVTNNLIINTGIVPDYPDFYSFYQDEDKLPKGIINVDTLEAAWIEDYWQGTYPVASDADRKILVDRNNAWWDSRFQTMFDSQLATFPDTIDQQWNNQMIKMNTRTQAMFDDNDAYPYFTEGTWYNEDPAFTTIEDIVPDWVSFIVTNAIPGAPNGGDPQPVWRTNEETDLTTVDWPILADLSYSSTTLSGAGLNGYPLGDLNWYPSLKESWEATSEADTIIARMRAGEALVDYATGIDDDEISALAQNVQVYPNPVNTMATVKFNLPNSSNVNLIVYNILGERVREVELGYYGAGANEFNFNKGDLKAGMYIIQLNTKFNKGGYTTKITIK